MDVQRIDIQSPAFEADRYINFRLKLPKHDIGSAQTPPHIDIRTAVTDVRVDLRVRSAGIEPAPNIRSLHRL